MKNIINFLKEKIDFPAFCMLVMTLIFLAVLIWIAFLNLTTPSNAEASQRDDTGYTMATYANYDIYAVQADVISLVVSHIEATEKQKADEERSKTISNQRRQNTASAPQDGSRWDQLAQCECGGNWGCNTGNGFGGGLQFMHQRSYSTWLSFGGGEFAPHPWEASREQQIAVAERVLASSGWGAWPGCSRKFGWL